MHDFLQREGGLRIKPDKRLIKYEKLRLVDQRRDDRHLLLHAMRVGSDQVSQGIRHLKEIRVPLYAFFPLGGADTEYIRDKIQILDPGQILIEIRVVRDICRDLLALHWLILHGMTVYIDFSLGKIQNADHGADCR